MNTGATIREGQVLTGPLFSEPIRVETVRSNGPGVWVAGLVGQQSERFRRVTLTPDDIASLDVADASLSYDGEPLGEVDHGLLGAAEVERGAAVVHGGGRFRDICQTALEGLASRKLNLDMLIELEWVTPGHPLFEALRLHSLDQGLDSLARGACFHSIAHEVPTRLDFYRARVVDGLGKVIHERLFALELQPDHSPRLRGPPCGSSSSTRSRGAGTSRTFTSRISATTSPASTWNRVNSA